jgi:phosphatidylglycerol lysyltransferase
MVSSTISNLQPHQQQRMRLLDNASNLLTSATTAEPRAWNIDDRLHRVETCIEQYGWNSTSYLALETDKHQFLHQRVDGTTAYASFNRVAIACGETICSFSRIAEAVDEFMDFAHSHKLQPIWFEVSERVAPLMQAKGFHLLKTGEEPFFDLDRFTLKGNKMANVRSSGNTARKRGVTVREYNPVTQNTASINQQLEAISQQWLQTRGLNELSFTLGSFSLDQPGARQYFIAEQDGKVIAFLTYTPIYARQGVYLDLMRRCEETPPGTMDLLLSESFQLLAESGIKLVSLGMSPLANVQETNVEQSKRLAWLLQQLSVHGSGFYNFKQIHDFKRKFQPHFWESKYLAYQHLGVREVDALLQALLRQNLAGLVWQLLNTPIHIGPF